MTPRIAAICAIVVLAICGARARAQLPVIEPEFPDCAHTSIEGREECQRGVQGFYFMDHGQVKGCAHTNIEGQADCQSGAQAVSVVNTMTDKQVKVTIRVALVDAVPGVITSVDQVLTLAPRERRELGCLVYPPQYPPQLRYTWTLVACQPL